MQFDSYCIKCQIDRQFKTARELFSPEDAQRYLMDVMDMILHAPKGVCASFFTPQLQELRAKYGAGGDLYAEEKRWANETVMPLLPQIEQRIEASPDPLLTALKFSQAGNFMDFAIIRANEVSDTVPQLLERAPDTPLDENEYRHFAEDLASAKQLLILGDNAGEIALDTLLVKQIRRQFPNLRILYGVRGGIALNDATREDAAFVGMDKLAEVIDNGSCISATELAYLGEEMKRELEKSDVILAKGQANFESMAGCGGNVYYNFLCKCERYCAMLDVPKYTGMFLCDRRLPKLKIFP